MLSNILPNLTIRITSEEERIIKRLKYLETPECRNKLEEEERVKKRKEATDQLREVLMKKNLLTNGWRDELYS